MKNIYLWGDFVSISSRLLKILPGSLMVSLITVCQLVQAADVGLRLLDATGNPTTVIDEHGNPSTALPDLGIAAAVNAKGQFLDTTARFRGGVSVGNKQFVQQATVTLADTVAIQGAIEVDSDHVNKVSEIIVAAGNDFPPEQFFMLDDMQIKLWDLQLSSLTAFKKNVKLGAVQSINMYTGKFVYPGILRIWFGYRLTDGTVVFNVEKTINITIKP